MIIQWEWRWNPKPYVYGEIYKKNKNLQTIFPDEAFFSAKRFDIFLISPQNMDIQ